MLRSSGIVYRAAQLTARPSNGRVTAGLAASRFESTNNLLQQAHRALNGKDYEKARTMFMQLCSEPNSTIDTHYNLGVVQWLSKDPKAAVKSWQVALRNKSDDKAVQSDCHTNLANYFLLFEPNLKKALEHLKAASELSPEDGEIRHNYGLALEKDDQIELALENYLRAEELGVQKDINALITNAGAKLLKRNSAYPPTKEEIEALKADVEPMGTQVDYGPSGTGR